MPPAKQAIQALHWIAPTAILLFAALLRLWALARPDTLVFDELYYVRDAVSQLAHGYPTVWPDRDPAFGGERATAFGEQAASIAHPPLGKWLIGLGVLLFGADSGWGWRVSVALAGVATVAVTMRLGFLLSRSMWIACLAGLLLAIDGVHVVLSRVSLLDGFLALFVVTGALFVWRYAESSRRVWLFAAGLSFGAATAVKWSGLYALAAFLVLITVRDLLIRVIEARNFRAEDRRRGRPRPVLAAVAQALLTAALALPAALAAYLASWAGWAITAGRQGDAPWWEALWRWHSHTLGWHTTLETEHPFQSGALTWPLALRPTAMYSELGESYVAVISPVPNLLVTWGGVLALLLLAWVVLRSIGRSRRDRSLAPLGASTVWVAAFVLTGYLSGWLPWVLTFSRSAVFQFYAVAFSPFAALALALALVSFAGLAGRLTLWADAGIRLGGSPEALRTRRTVVTGFLTLALVLTLLFWPLWSAQPVAPWYWRSLMWLPGWS